MYKTSKPLTNNATAHLSRRKLNAHLVGAGVSKVRQPFVHKLFHIIHNVVVGQTENMAYDSHGAFGDRHF